MNIVNIIIDHLHSIPDKVHDPVQIIDYANLKPCCPCWPVGGAQMCAHSRHGLLVDDASIEARFRRPTFRALLYNIPIRVLPIGAIAVLLQQTRFAGELAVQESDLEAYCRNASDYGYSQTQTQRGAAVVEIANRGTQTTKEYFLHVFPIVNDAYDTDLPGGYMNLLMKLRTHYGRFMVDEEYESISLSKDLYRRRAQVGLREKGPSLASELLGLPELRQELPSKADVQALLAKAAALARIHRSILAIPNSSAL